MTTCLCVRVGTGSHTMLMRRRQRTAIMRRSGSSGREERVISNYDQYDDHGDADSA